MVDVVIAKTERLTGEVYAPSSKAYTQRTLIAALLSHGTSRILNPLVSDDTKVTLRAVKAFGARVKLQKDCWTIEGATPIQTPETRIDCNESGATLRFMIPVAALASDSSIFSLGGSLKRRPVKALLQCLKQLGVRTRLQQNNGSSSVMVQGGGISGGKAAIRGDVSSQFISGLLFACPMAKADTEITLTTPLESKNYVRMTEEILAKHSIKISRSDGFEHLQVPSNQIYSPCTHEIEGDFSSAAFLLAAGAIIPSKVCIKNLASSSIQGDKAIVDILTKMGSNIEVGNGQIEVKGDGSLLDAVDIEAKDIPDLVPVCAVLACRSKGTSRIYAAQRLRYKESDRLTSLYTELKKMGAEVAMGKDSLIINGPCALHGNIITAHEDHRIAMACAIAALNADGTTRIKDAECVKKSYPTFFDDLRALGVNIIGGKFDR